LGIAKELKVDETIVKQYDAEDREGIIDLLKRTFPKTSNEATFKWRFEADNKNRPMLILAKHHDVVISFCSWIPWEFCHKDKKLLGYQNGEAATDIHYRGKGVFSKILKYANETALERDIDFLFCYFHSDSLTYGPTIKAGYYPVAVNYFSVRPISPFCKTVPGSFSLNPNFASGTMLKESDKITPIIDHDYCKWRYLDNTKHYEIIEYSENNGLAIFYLRKKKYKGFNELVLLDCQFNNFNDEFIKTSLNFLERIFSRKVVFIRTFFNEFTDRGKALRRHFPFRVKMKSYIFCIKPLSNRVDQNTFLNCNNWDTMPHCVDEL
jgi:hypothetical protein